ncbi:MAG: hypothetical protein HQ498_04490 [Pseudohongiella sp.]|nr:hypothetical protein [Pseudohongiella sp.]
MSRIDLQNYCMAFVDILGQRDAMRGEGLLPAFEKDGDEEKFRARIKNSVGQIVRLQEAAKHYLVDRPELSIRDQLTEEQREAYDESKRLRMKQQRWSDGLVLYTSMAGKTPMNAIFDIFGTAGGLCFMGLGQKEPLRGGIDISWGAELHEGEIYGAVVANSYELETIAQYPRIVVGNRVIQYLDSAIDHANEDEQAEQINKALAQICRAMVCMDTDGQHIINYLGETFTECFTKDNSAAMFSEAYGYASEQYELHRDARNAKLAIRYNWLLAYFEAHKAFHSGSK